MPRGDRLPLGQAYVAAALWRLYGYGRGGALPFWAAPVSRIDALARQGGGDSSLGIWAASPRRQDAVAANSTGCSPPRAGSPCCRGAPVPVCSNAGAVALSRTAGHRKPTRKQARHLWARRSGPHCPAHGRGRAPGNDGASRLAGVRHRLRVADPKRMRTGSRSARCGPPHFAVTRPLYRTAAFILKRPRRQREPKLPHETVKQPGNVGWKWAVIKPPTMCAHTPLRDTPEYKKFCSHGRSTQGVAFHYELLDKDVPRGEVPLTAAFGWTGEMNLLKACKLAGTAASTCTGNSPVPNAHATCLHFEAGVRVSMLRPRLR